MKAATAKQIKEAISNQSPVFISETILRLSRFKKENKELLSYLLFYANEEHEYLKDVKEELLQLFEGINTSSVFIAKKSLRKILRVAGKYSRYTNIDESDLEIYIYLATLFTSLPSSFKKNKQVANMYANILKKINALLITIHSDLQYDYTQQLSILQSNF